MIRRPRLPHQAQVRPGPRTQVLPRRRGEEKVRVAVLQGGAARRADCLHRRRPAADGVVPQ